MRASSGFIKPPSRAFFLCLPSVPALPEVTAAPDGVGLERI